MRGSSAGGRGGMPAKPCALQLTSAPAAAAIARDKCIDHQAMRAAGDQFCGKLCAVRQTRRNDDLRAHAGFDSGGHRRQAFFQDRRVWPVGEIVAVGFNRHAQPGIGNGGNLGEVVRHQRAARLNHQQIEIRIAREHVQTAPRHAHTPLQRLVRIGHGTHEDSHRRAPSGFRQFRREQFRRVGFQDDGIAPRWTASDHQ